MTQSTFNRTYTLLLTFFFMGMYVYGFITGKPLDIAGLLAFSIPTGNHIVHQITGSQAILKNIEKDTSVAVAKITANGVSPS